MAKLTKEVIEQNLTSLSGQAGQIQAAAMFEAGKTVGRVEGQLALLQQLVQLAEPAEAVADALKLAEAEPAEA